MRVLPCPIAIALEPPPSRRSLPGPKVGQDVQHAGLRNALANRQEQKLSGLIDSNPGSGVGRRVASLHNLPLV
jgi:hypothetical protein